MRRFLAAVMLALALLGRASAQEATPSPEVRELTLAGAGQYKDGNFVEAQRLFEQAMALDPQSKALPLFIARAIHQQYRPAVDTPENRAKGEEAVAAYKRILERDPHNEDAFNAVAYLYRQMRDDERLAEWISARANDASAPAERRSDAYMILASRMWQCSNDITEQRQNKEVVDRGEAGAAVRYRKPRSQADFDRALQCTHEGVTLIEQALALNPENGGAWAYKTNLLREMSKLAQMEGDAPRKAELDRQAEAAEAEFKRLAAEKNGGGGEGPLGAPGPVGPVGPVGPPGGGVIYGTPEGPEPPPAGDREPVISGGVLNGKATSKHAPAYPAEALAARASGRVTVRVLVDEEGNVVEAEAVSGHPLLHDASVEAVRRWTFSPTRLSGRPVKVRGVVLVNFNPPGDRPR